MATATACKPNDANVVSPSRERSSQDEFTVVVNMASSLPGLLLKTPEAITKMKRTDKKNRAWCAAFWELIRHLRCRGNYFGCCCCVVGGVAGLGAGALGAAGLGADAPCGVGAATPDCTL